MVISSGRYAPLMSVCCPEAEICVTNICIVYIFEPLQMCLASSVPLFPFCARLLPIQLLDCFSTVMLLFTNESLKSFPYGSNDFICTSEFDCKPLCHKQFNVSLLLLNDIFHISFNSILLVCFILIFLSSLILFSYFLILFFQMICSIQRDTLINAPSDCLIRLP